MKAPNAHSNRKNNLMAVLFSGIAAVASAQTGGYSSQGQNYRSPDFTSYSDRTVGQPSYVIKNNLKASTSLSGQNRRYESEQVSNMQQDLGDSSVYHAGEHVRPAGKVAVVHESRPHVVHAPVHHVPAPAPHVVSVREEGDKVIEDVAVPTATGYEIEEFEHNMKCHDNPTFVHDVDFNSCPCGAPAAPVAFAELGEERKYTGVFPWWLIPLILLGLLLIGKLFVPKLLDIYSRMELQLQIFKFFLSFSLMFDL